MIIAWNSINAYLVEAYDYILRILFNVEKSMEYCKGKQYFMTLQLSLAICITEFVYLHHFLGKVRVIR